MLIGGIGIEGGTVIVSNEGVDGQLRNIHEMVIQNDSNKLKKFIINVIINLKTVLGKVIHRPAKLDQKLARELMSLADPEQDAYETITGKTMCTNDFYEGNLLIK